MYKAITLANAIKAIHSYNIGLYNRGRKNIEIDREARDKFKNGLGDSIESIMEQIAFIAKEYGGVKFNPAVKQLPSKIAEMIFKIRNEYQELIDSLLPLENRMLNKESIRFLYSAFHVPLDVPHDNKKNWLTMATKCWHFLNPNVFPILDSKALRFFSFSDVPNKVDLYYDFTERFRENLLSRKEWLPELRAADKGHSWSVIKLWDKIAYELGV